MVVHFKGYALGSVGKFAEVEVIEGLAGCHHEMIDGNFLCNLDCIAQPGFVKHKFSDKRKRGISELDNSFCITRCNSEPASIFRVYIGSRGS